MKFTMTCKGHARTLLTVALTASCLYLAACPAFESRLATGRKPIRDYLQSTWVSDSGLTEIDDTFSVKTIPAAPGADSMIFWRQGPPPEYAAPLNGAPPTCRCERLYFTAGGALKMITASTVGAGSTSAKHFIAGAPLVDTVAPRTADDKPTTTSVDLGGRSAFEVDSDHLDGGTVYVSFPNNAAVGIVSGQNGTLTGTISLPGRTPKQLAIAGGSAFQTKPDGEKASLDVVGYALSGSSVISFNQKGEQGHAAVEDGSTAIGTDGEYVVVVSELTDKVQIFDAKLSLLRTVDTSKTGFSPVKVAVWGIAYVLATNEQEQGAILRIGLRDGAVTQTVKIGNCPADIKVTEYNDVFASNKCDNTVSTMSESGSFLGSVLFNFKALKVGNSPAILAVSPEDDHYE